MTDTGILDDDALTALRLVPVPDLDKGLMARVGAVRWNDDLIKVAAFRETNAPVQRAIIADGYGNVTVWAFIAPSACRWCDLEERDHGRRWCGLVGDHDYTAPSNQMRLSRMRGRRAFRIT